MIQDKLNARLKYEKEKFNLCEMQLNITREWVKNGSMSDTSYQLLSKCAFVAPKFGKNMINIDKNKLVIASYGENGYCCQKYFASYSGTSYYLINDKLVGGDCDYCGCPAFSYDDGTYVASVSFATDDGKTGLSRVDQSLNYSSKLKHYGSITDDIQLNWDLLVCFFHFNIDMIGMVTK